MVEIMDLPNFKEPVPFLLTLTNHLFKFFFGQGLDA